MIADDIRRGQGGCIKCGEGGVEVPKSLELCVLHADVCRGWKGWGEYMSTPEVADVAARQELKEAGLQG